MEIELPKRGDQHTKNPFCQLPYDIGNEMIAPLDVCPSQEKRLPVSRLPVMEKTFAPQDICPSGSLPVMEKTFAPQDVFPLVVCPSGRLPVSRLPVMENTRYRGY